MCAYPKNLAPTGPISRMRLASASPSSRGGGCVSFSFLTSLQVTRVGMQALRGGMMIRTPEWRQPRIAPPRASTMKLTRKLHQRETTMSEYRTWQDESELSSVDFWTMLFDSYHLIWSIISNILSEKVILNIKKKYKYNIVSCTTDKNDCEYVFTKCTQVMNNIHRSNFKTELCIHIFLDNFNINIICMQFTQRQK